MKLKEKKRKSERVKISSIEEFKNVLLNEGYNIISLNDESFKNSLMEFFNIDRNIIENLFNLLKEDIIYKVNDSKDLIEYIKNIINFEEKSKMLIEKISIIDKLYIERVEYDRILRTQDNVINIIKEIEKIKEKISERITSEELLILEKIENEIDEEYIYTKDIELLKKMILINNKNVKEDYRENERIKSLFIDIKEDIDFKYIKAERGSVEYHEHIKSNIPRLTRLIKNLNKYLIEEDKNLKIFKINQSDTLQDSINIAIAIYQGKEFKAISGQKDIRGSCSAPRKENVTFKSCKVNKLGNIGVGYKRINDSEKKILEEINRLIENNEIKAEGELVLYSKWEPCSSCYYVMSQFCNKYPNINLKIKYYKKYGER